MSTEPKLFDEATQKKIAKGIQDKVSDHFLKELDKKDKAEKEAAKHKVPVLSRAQRRWRDNVELTYKKLCAQFELAFLDCDDPDSVEIHELVKRLSSKWKVYCHKKRIKDEAHLAIYQYCDGMIQQYKEEIAGQNMEVLAKDMKDIPTDIAKVVEDRFNDML